MFGLIHASFTEWQHPCVRLIVDGWMACQMHYGKPEPESQSGNAPATVNQPQKAAEGAWLYTGEAGKTLRFHEKLHQQCRAGDCEHQSGQSRGSHDGPELRLRRAAASVRGSGEARRSKTLTPSASASSSASPRVAVMNSPLSSSFRKATVRLVRRASSRSEILFLIRIRRVLIARFLQARAPNSDALDERARSTDCCPLVLRF
jgi:hypothetical protein